jgi:hypothetical protein
MAWDGQMYDGPRAPDTPTNLWHPVPGHVGAHGEFDDRSSDAPTELWLTTRLPWGAITAIGLAGLGLAALKALK